MARSVKAKEVDIAIDFGVMKLETKWVPDPRQREAAWALFIELSTRIATQPLDLDEGGLREALESLHELFPAALAKHTRLETWEAKRPQRISTRDHERAWELEPKCRGELEKLRQGLVTYAQALATISNA